MSTATSTMTLRTAPHSVGSTSKVVLVDLTPNNIGTVRKINSVLFPVRYSDKFYSQVLQDHLADFCKLIYFNDLPVGAVCCRVEPNPTSLIPVDAPNLHQVQTPQAKLYIMTLGILAPYRRLGLATQLLNHVIQQVSKTHDVSLGTCTSNSDSTIITPIPSTITTTTTTTTTTTLETKKIGQKNKKGLTNHKTLESINKQQANPSSSSSLSLSSSSNVQTNKREEEDIKIKLPKLESIYVHVQDGNEEAKKFYLSHGFELEGEVVKDYYKKIVPRDAWVFSKRI